MNTEGRYISIVVERVSRKHFKTSHGTFNGRLSPSQAMTGLFMQRRALNTLCFRPKLCELRPGWIDFRTQVQGNFKTHGDSQDFTWQKVGDWSAQLKFFPYLLSTHADRHVVDISFTVCLFVFLFLCPQDFGNVVTDISGVGWPRAMKFCRMVDVAGYQVFCFFDELCPRG